MKSKTVWSLAQRNSESQQVSSSVDDEGADFSWQRVDNQDKEERQDDEDDQGYYVFLVVFPDQEDKGLHRIDEPVEAGGRTAAKTKNNNNNNNLSANSKTVKSNINANISFCWGIYTWDFIWFT